MLRASATAQCCPAWAAQTDHDFLVEQPPGLREAADTLQSLCNPEFGPFDTSVKQAVRARFHEHGFEAAAITGAIALAASPLVERVERILQRTIELRFNRPYAAVAITVNRSAVHRGQVPDAWHGMPVFSAWISEPTEPDATP